MKKARNIIITAVIILAVAAMGYIAWFTINNKSMPAHVLKDNIASNDTIITYTNPSVEPISVVEAADTAVNDGIVNAF